MSLVDFKCAEYGDGKVIADGTTRKCIVEIGIRKIARESEISRETLALISEGKPVKPCTLQRVLKVLGAC